jgi:hypothetical protein
MTSISEADWKVFKRVHAAGVQRFCSRVLKEVAQLVNSPAADSHQHYLKLYKLIDERNNQMADVFDDYRRSTAFWQIAKMIASGVLTDEEFAQFSEPTRNSLNRLRQIAES